MVSLCRVAKDRFGYALANGIVGLYGGSERFWRIKVCVFSMYTCTCTGETWEEGKEGGREGGREGGKEGGREGGWEEWRE